MSTLVLGDEPDRLELKLTRGDGFFQEVELSEDGEPVAWPPGTSAWLVVKTHGSTAGQQWRATVVGALMTFDEDPDAVDAVGAHATARLVLQYGDEATPFTGWRGDVTWS